MTGKTIFFLFISALGICSTRFFFPSQKECYEINRGHSWEQYDPLVFHQYQSIKAIIDTADKQFAGKRQNTVLYFNLVADIVRKRFYHGFSNYSLSDNPLAYLSGKVLWNHLSAIVIPDDIMKHPMAACSQQAIVLMKIFNQKGINYRKIGFPGHYTVEAMIEGQWRYFDTDLEPIFEKREPLDSIIASNKFISIYRNVSQSEDFKKQTAYYVKGEINKDPAPRAKLFHRICYIFSSPHFYFTLLLLFIVLNFEKVTKSNSLSRKAIVLSFSKVAAKKKHQNLGAGKQIVNR